MILDINTLTTALACGIASGLGQWIGSNIFPLLGTLIQSRLSVR